MDGQAPPHGRASASGKAPPPPKFRVHVSGLAKTVVHRKVGEAGYEEEGAVASFFSNAGCSVSQVSLLVDNRNKRSRGFAFVEFDDEESFNRACALNGSEDPEGVKLDEKSTGRLQVSPARPSQEDAQSSRHEELAAERSKSESLDQSLRHIAARISEKMPLILGERARQLELHEKAFNKFRVHVSGLAKTVVHKKEGDQGYEEESAVADFFQSSGCSVAQVSLLVDNRNKRSRGFAFVEFDDEASFNKACALNGTKAPGQIKLDDRSTGKLQVSTARPSPDDMRSQASELMQERRKTEGLEKTLRLVAVRINEKLQRVAAQRARHLAAQDKATPEEALQEESQRQKSILSEIEDLNHIEALLAKELLSETERTQAISRELGRVPTQDI